MEGIRKICLITKKKSQFGLRLALGNIGSGVVVVGKWSFCENGKVEDDRFEFQNARGNQKTLALDPQR